MTFDITKLLPTRSGKPSKADSLYISFRPTDREKRQLLALVVANDAGNITNLLRKLTAEAYAARAEFMPSDLRAWVEGE